jgi:pyrroline-5-carboxylate reductase
MLRAWLDRAYDPRQISVIEPHPSPEVIELAHSKGLALGAPSRPPQVLVLAMKPQNFDEESGELASLVGPGTLIISILAGKTIANIATKLPQASGIIRAMPNLPAAVGRSITALAANEPVTLGQRTTAEALLGATGLVVWLAGEHLIDAVTAVSGSGPAYVFYLAEALANAGTAIGLPAELAARLARATIEGAGELLFQNPGSSVAELREKVTSPGGTTAAALSVLMAQDGLVPLIERAVRAAKQRAVELSG